ncbi:MAG: peptidylprolyl isomerase [Bacillota bacterium]
MSAITVLMNTSKGDITIEVYPDKMPITAGNFIDLVSQGFYDGLTFHRVEHWVVQGGDPKGNGTGGSGKRIKLETHPDLKNVRGCIAMARAQHPDSASSQFYFLKKDAPWLDGQYAVFGMVRDGMNVVDQIEVGDRMEKIRVIEE